MAPRTALLMNEFRGGKRSVSPPTESAPPVKTRLHTARRHKFARAIDTNLQPRIATHLLYDCPRRRRAHAVNDMFRCAEEPKAEEPKAACVSVAQACRQRGTTPCTTPPHRRVSTPHPPLVFGRNTRRHGHSRGVWVYPHVLDGCVYAACTPLRFLRTDCLLPGPAAREQLPVTFRCFRGVTQASIFVFWNLDEAIEIADSHDSPHVGHSHVTRYT